TRDRRPDAVFPKVRRERLGGRQGLPRRGRKHGGGTRHREIHRRARRGRRVHCPRDVLVDGIDPPRPRCRYPGTPLMAGTLGIIGAGRLGQALARTVRRADRPVVIANSRGPETLTAVADALGAGVRAGATHDAARCPIVALAVPWVSMKDAVSGLAWTGQILID